MSPEPMSALRSVVIVAPEKHLGGLSSGDVQSQSSYQIAGTQSGFGGMAAAFLRGNIKVGIGYGHGWHPVGSRFRVTRSRSFWRGKSIPSAV